VVQVKGFDGLGGPSGHSLSIGPKLAKVE
jgi:hypothetical protein